jgi:hypothetical protein
MCSAPRTGTSLGSADPSSAVHSRTLPIASRVSAADPSSASSMPRIAAPCGTPWAARAPKRMAGFSGTTTGLGAAFTVAGRGAGSSLPQAADTTAARRRRGKKAVGIER